MSAEAPSMPLAPSAEEQARRGEADRAAVVATIEGARVPGELRSAVAQGDAHLDARIEIRDVLRTYFASRKTKTYVASELRVAYPREPVFFPDILAVRDVESHHPRRSWVVSRERKGLDLVMEIHDEGDWQKDHEAKLAKLARLGVREYFVFDCARLRLLGHRLPTAGADAYAPLVAHGGRLTSEVLDLDLVIFGGRLRFFAGNAELLTLRERVGRLEGMVDEITQQRDEAEAERDRAVESIRNALLAVLEVRRLAVADDEHAAVAACRDPERLAWWLARAALVPAVAELFETA